MARLDIPTPPDAPDEETRRWRYGIHHILSSHDFQIEEVEAAAAVEALPSSRTWPGFSGAAYPVLYSGRAANSWVAWELQTDTPYLLWVSTSADRVIVCDRIYDRWRIMPSASTPFAGIKEITITDPVAICWVPYTGADTTRGKFWVSSSASDAITTIDPYNSFATATFALGASESNVSFLEYDATNDRVWAITGGGTRICEIDPADGSNDAQSTGWTGLTWLAPAGAGKLWLSKTSGLVTERLQYLDPSDITVAATNPGITVSTGVQSITYCSGIDQVFWINSGGDQRVGLADNSADTGVELNTGYNHWGRPAGWIEEVRTIALGGQGTMLALDAYTGAIVHAGYVENFRTSGSVHSMRYIPEYKEILCFSDGIVNLSLWVCPSTLEPPE